MVARRDRDRSKSPCGNISMELDNRALKAKNSSLTQTVAKLQQDNAELLKQLNLVQGENFEINSRYNNLKNVISIIDSSTKTCLPKLNEVVDTFSGIIQLCSVAANLSNYFAIVNNSTNKDTRTQAVKPHIVNGHVLHNPTITLSRLSNEITLTPPRPNRSAEMVRPSTSRGFEEQISNRNEDDKADSDSDDSEDANEEQETTFVCRANRSSCRAREENNIDMSRLRVEEYEDSDEENEEPVVEEEESDEEHRERLTTIHEVDEEEEQMYNSVSPRSRHRRFLNGRLQEVRIYLNQLPNTYIEQFRGAGNISISVSPPERRSSFKHRTSSLVGEVNDSVMDNGRMYLDEQVNLSRLSQGEKSYNESSRQGESNSKMNVSFKSSLGRSPTSYEAGLGMSSNMSNIYGENMSAIHNLQASSASTSAGIRNDSNSMQSETLQELDLLHLQLQHRTSTPIVQRISGGSRYDSPNRSKTGDSIMFKNITKRRSNSREQQRKVAQVILDRLSIEKRLSRSPIKGMKDLVNLPPIRKSSDLSKSLKKEDEGEMRQNAASADQENVGKKGKSSAKGRRRKRDSPTMKAGAVAVIPKKTSPPKSPAAGRPKRAARPKTLKEPNLNRKMRRSK
ncbi:hypothetical protein NQ315_001669 [Exocentrus adspersus]|uniref:Shugoshin C-terminal domain-containing protein n=1 Tax=Exocentrus adspersus TaxID=1586481 RepID=A0AAV8W925_9CUCU|nr:hypothetical protein NQ315_001669 [Exocentrus adspersus]